MIHARNPIPRPDVGEDRIERGKISVKVGDQCVSHSVRLRTAW